MPKKTSKPKPPKSDRLIDILHPDKVEKPPQAMRLEFVSIDDVKRWPRNPKKHDEAGIRASIERFGFVEPLVMDEKSGRLVSGHGRLTALMEMRHEGKPAPKGIRVEGSEWSVPVLRGVEFANTTEAEMFVVAVNQLVIKGGFDDRALAAIISNAKATLADFNDMTVAIGLNDLEINRIIAAAKTPTLADAPERASGSGQGKTVTFQAKEKEPTVVRCARCGHENIVK